VGDAHGIHHFVGDIGDQFHGFVENDRNENDRIAINDGFDGEGRRRAD